MSSDSFWTRCQTYLRRCRCGTTENDRFHLTGAMRRSWKNTKHKQTKEHNHNPLKILRLASLPSCLFQVWSCWLVCTCWWHHHSSTVCSNTCDCTKTPQPSNNKKKQKNNNTTLTYFCTLSHLKKIVSRIETLNHKLWANALLCDFKEDQQVRDRHIKKTYSL